MQPVSDPLAFIAQIRFAHLQPTDPCPDPAQDACTEIANTCLPDTADIDCQRLSELCQIPRMSTFALGALIQRIVATLPAGQCFLNIGVWHGFTFLAGLNPAHWCLGVDCFNDMYHCNARGEPVLFCRGAEVRDAFYRRFERWRDPRYHHFFELDFRAYLARHRRPIGFYLYDGDHSYRSQLDALLLAEPYLAAGAYILIDDTNAPEVRQSVTDFLALRPGQYQVKMDFTTCANRHPTWWNGVILLQKTGGF
jgi:hypothetical protein